MIRIEVDAASLSRVQRKLGRMKSEAPKVIAKALNQTAKQARKRLADKARQAYTVKTGKFNSNMKIKNATAGNLEAEIRSQGKPLNITNFKYSAPKSGAKAQVVTGGGLKALIMGNIKAFKGMNGLIWQRRSAARTPIKPLKSNSIPKMLGSEKRVYGIVRPYINKDLKKNIDTQIKALVR
nr:phage tail protein [uncultured Dysosmobacter sp.]